MGTAIKHPMPDRVKLSFVIFDIWGPIYKESYEFHKFFLSFS